MQVGTEAYDIIFLLCTNTPPKQGQTKRDFTSPCIIHSVVIKDKKNHHIQYNTYLIKNQEIFLFSSKVLKIG